jgi:hypothetical protein
MRFVILFFAVLSFFAAGCSKKMPDEEVTAKVAESLCAKMKECATGSAVDANMCVSALKSSLMTPLEAHGKKGKVTEKELNSCVKEIQSQNCATFSAPAASSACSFFKG